MEIKPKELTVRQLCENYMDNNEGGVVAYGGKLDVRPPYQREFVYDQKDRDAVIDTVLKNFPLNVMYWADREDGTYEIIDGQQRTISICQYVTNVFSVVIDGMPRKFFNLTKDIQDKIMDYKLFIYVCRGTESEKLDWFKTINIAGKVLNQQELRNAVYHGAWLTDAKRYFSKTNGPAAQISKNYVGKVANRQEILETALSWISGGKVQEYMDDHAKDADAQPLKDYFEKVIEWVSETFPKVRATQMKGVNWGELYNRYKDVQFDVNELEEKIARLMKDSDVTNKSGIYVYVLDPDKQEKVLSIRTFDDNTRRSVYEKQEGKCYYCGKPFPIEKMHADHIIPWSKGGRTIEENCCMSCIECNLKKSDK